MLVRTVKFGSEVENQRLLLMAAISFVVSKNTEVAIHKQKKTNFE